MSDLQCMLQRDETRLWVAGHQNLMLEVDLKKGVVCNKVITRGCQGGGRLGEDGRCMGGGRRGAGSGRKWEKSHNIVQYFEMEKCKEAGANKYRVGTGIKGYGKWEVKNPLSPRSLPVSMC